MSKTNNSFKPLIKVVLFAVAIILTPFVYAAPGHDGDKAKTGELTVSMASITETEIRVDVNVANEEANRLTLIIENDRGEELYRKDLDKKGFHSRVRFPKANNIVEYKIVLKAGQKTLAQYKIEATARVVEDVTISKL
jgi:hypothetical protein